MPYEVREKIGEIHRVRTEKTLWDKVKEVVGGVIGVIFVLAIIGAIFG